MTTSVLSLSGYMGRTNNVILYHVVGAKKNVIYFPGDTQVRCYSISSMVLLVWYGIILFVQTSQGVRINAHVYKISIYIIITQVVIRFKLFKIW